MRNSDHSQSDDSKWVIGSNNQRVLVHHHLLEFVFRLFTTISLTGFAAAGGASWHTLRVVIPIGLLGDILRHVMAPECRISAARVWYQFESGVTRTNGFKSKHRYWFSVLNYIFAFWIGYAVLTSSLIQSGEIGTVPSILIVSEPLRKTFLLVSSFDRRATAELIRHGYPNRAILISLIYSANVIFYAVVLISLYSGFGMAMALDRIERSSLKGPRTWGLSRIRWTATAQLVFGILGHMALSNASNLNWDDTNISMSWDLAHSGMGVMWFTLGEAGSMAFFSLSYHLIVAARTMELGPSIPTDIAIK